MKTFICEICGDAYIGSEKPHNCPFCGARTAFIKNGNEANPIVIQDIEVSELTRKNLLETLGLEMHANAIYLCMAGKADAYEIKAMYKRLAKVELEHATIVTKILKMDMPEKNDVLCDDNDIENFKKTIELEEHAAGLYAKFAREAEETPVKIMFTAINQVEQDHIELIKNYI